MLLFNTLSGCTLTKTCGGNRCEWYRWWIAFSVLARRVLGFWTPHRRPIWLWINYSLTQLKWTNEERRTNRQKTNLLFNPTKPDPMSGLPASMDSSCDFFSFSIRCSSCKMRQCCLLTELHKWQTWNKQTINQTAITDLLLFLCGPFFLDFAELTQQLFLVVVVFIAATAITAIERDVGVVKILHSFNFCGGG